MLYAKGEKGMFATGPEMTLEILPSESLEKEETSIVRVNVSKGKKNVFKDDIMISRKDTDNHRKYIHENFQAGILTWLFFQNSWYDSVTLFDDQR